MVKYQPQDLIFEFKIFNLLKSIMKLKPREAIHCID